MLKDTNVTNSSTLERVQVEGEAFYRISNVDQMDPFLMSIVSDSNHWMFISSNGGLSAGRKDTENALFPYYTDDKITESADLTGSKSIFWVSANGQQTLWEPFSERQLGVFNYTRNLYKNYYGNKVLFEEINHDLGLTFRYQWNSSNEYGFVKRSSLINHSNASIEVRLLDGIQNIMPYGVTSDLQVNRSNLVDAYKKCELEADFGIGIYALSAIIVDRAEPSEALKANVAWSLGLDNPHYLLSSTQLGAFRRAEALKQEVDIKARKGAYFVEDQVTIAANEQKSWMIIANVNQTATTIAALGRQIKENKDLERDIQEDIEAGSKELMNLVAASDGIQYSSDEKRNARHFANTLFNIMRGGIFDNNYLIEKWDFENYLRHANKSLAGIDEFLEELPDKFSYLVLKDSVQGSSNNDLIRLAIEYMPLKFSRRHGDPSRPWNKFTINTRSEIDGSKILDYEGNWRDIFQNWEALAKAYPEFLESMIMKFLNASTFDGYNPYRVTKDGFDWEVIEEHDPWSYIGYWGDHQIIYLLKFLESIQDHYPNKLTDYFDKDFFVYANVPYKIKSYEDLLDNPKDTITFDEGLDKEIRERRKKVGADGALLLDATGKIYRVNLMEKILATVLAKMSNFIPEGGIWLNTQRPEWNDANNALVGNGVSMVTLYYLRRFLAFFNELVQNGPSTQFEVSTELYDFFNGVSTTLDQHQGILSSAITDKQRKSVLDGLGQAGSTFRNTVYAQPFSGHKKPIDRTQLLDFLKVSLKFLEQSIDANKRTDNMYHAYNIMTVKNDEVGISYLDEMLEGQVSALSSQYLSAKESLDLLDAMKQSKLFRADQYSYLLYPNKQLPRFINKNVIPKEQVTSSTLLSRLLKDGNNRIIEQDVNGEFHFNGNFNNASSLKDALDNLSKEKYGTDINKDFDLVLQIFEGVFNHKAFTGRSGTFFWYEGLGSIYWHMVSKLLLAVEETCLRAIDEHESAEVTGRLLEHYYEINEGIGVNKSPKLYGAFSIDPYSHTPEGKGAQQPGMTGQVKEDILSRIGELGAFVKNGQLGFAPSLLRKEEFLDRPATFSYADVYHQEQAISLDQNTLAYTYCQVPIIYHISESDSIEVLYSDGKTEQNQTLNLNKDASNELFKRSGAIKAINVYLTTNHLK